MRAVARVELVPELLLQRHLAFEHLGGQQPLEQVVVAAVALAPREPEHAGARVGLEHGAHDVRRHAEPVDLVPPLALEVERRQRSVRADPLEHALGDLAIVGEEARRAQAPRRAEPWVLVGQDEREALVVRLEDVAPLVELVRPRRVVAGDARVQHEVVTPAGDGDRVELHRPPAAEDLERAVLASLERARGREHLARDEKAARILRGDLHERGR